jgi:uncharacterized membrane protein
MKLVTGHERLVTGHGKLVIGFMKLVTGHEIGMVYTVKKLYNLAFDDPHLMNYQIDYKTLVH